MKRRCKSGDEQDVHSKRWRRWLCWTQRAGACKAVKRRSNRRERQEAKAEIRREEWEADLTMNEGVERELRLTVKLTVEDLAANLAYELSVDEAILLVAYLDESMADWGFTEALYDYLGRMMREHPERGER